jgi:hypothetical protein
MHAYILVKGIVFEHNMGAVHVSDENRRLSLIRIQHRAVNPGVKIGQKMDKMLQCLGVILLKS